MAKFYYSQQRQRYEVSEVTPDGRRLIDHDTDGEALGLRQGFISDDESDTEFDPLEDETAE